jgi:hypothetical protein
MNQIGWLLLVLGALFVAMYAPIFFIARANGNLRKFFLMISQLLVVAACAALLVHWGGENAKGSWMIGGIIGMGVAYIVTVIPVKLLDRFRSRRALRTDSGLRKEPDYDAYDPRRRWPLTEQRPEVVEISPSEEPRKIGRTAP